jgi:hypothetical protein
MTNVAMFPITGSDAMQRNAIDGVRQLLCSVGLRGNRRTSGFCYHSQLISKMDVREMGCEDGTGSGPCPVAGSSTGGVEPSVSATRVS